MGYHYTVSTKKETEQLIKDLEASLKQDGFSVLWSFKIHDKLKEKGYDYANKVTVLEVCNPKDASGVLGVDPMASYFLPCKMIITEEENDTRIGLVSPKALLGFVESEKLDELADEIETHLKNAIDKAI